MIDPLVGTVAVLKLGAKQERQRAIVDGHNAVPAVLVDDLDVALAIDALFIVAGADKGRLYAHIAHL
jgi:hypothetical protein